ncbi:MAG TPA: phenylalanine--tRNA ligase subunit alpha, partial [Candidatus Polarisedimenticolaceae bacterium]|nr:phenylalanine--tRNA ligase subunit alpha [Candidatus Polarisedimenticolaceae bacterium]
MQQELERIEREFEARLSAAGDDLREIDSVRVGFLGKKGQVTALMKRLASLPADDKPAAGKAINELKRRVSDGIDRALAAARLGRRERELGAVDVDVTLPPRQPWVGSLHPVTRTRRDLERIFVEMGFRIETGPEVEDDFHNFQALNIPEDHPARDDTDTFYLEDGNL